MNNNTTTIAEQFPIEITYTNGVRYLVYLSEMEFLDLQRFPYIKSSVKLIRLDDTPDNEEVIVPLSWTKINHYMSYVKYEQDNMKSVLRFIKTISPNATFGWGGQYGDSLHITNITPKNTFISLKRDYPSMYSICDGDYLVYNMNNKKVTLLSSSQFSFLFGI